MPANHHEPASLQGTITIVCANLHGARQPQPGAEAPERTFGELKRATVKAGDIANDGEAEARAGHALIQALAALAHHFPFLGIKAGPIVVDAQVELAIGLLTGMYLDLAMGPLAGIVHQVAEHLFEVLPFAAERKLCWTIHADRECTLGVNA